MPVAVVMEEPEHFDLKTCPGGFVKIKRLTFGEKQTRRSFNSKMNMQTQKGSKNVNTELDIFSERAELWDFAKAVVAHNLTDVDERPLNFSNPNDVKIIAGNIAEEIQTYIDKVNNFELDEDLGK